jgi:Core histone H2A/H2B/H3/H4
MKADPEVKMISAEAPILFAKGCDIFITELTMRAWIDAEENKRRTLQRSDIASALAKSDMFDFLIDIVPREEGGGSIAREKDDRTERRVSGRTCCWYPTPRPASEHSPTSRPSLPTACYGSSGLRAWAWTAARAGLSSTDYVHRAGPDKSRNSIRPGSTAYVRRNRWDVWLSSNAATAGMHPVIHHLLITCFV